MMKVVDMHDDIRQSNMTSLSDGGQGWDFSARGENAGSRRISSISLAILSSFVAMICCISLLLLGSGWGLALALYPVFGTVCFLISIFAFLPEGDDWLDNE